MQIRFGVFFSCVLTLGLSLFLIPAVAQAPSAANDGGHATAPTNTVKHPDIAKGARHTALGVIRHVTCTYPSVLEFQLEAAKKTLALYSNNFAKIDLSVLGLTQDGPMNPCRDFEGKKARIQYAEAGDKTVDGQVIAIELRK
jgi:hypothetical protein